MEHIYESKNEECIKYGCFYFYGRDHAIYETCLLETNGCCAYRDIGIGCKENCYYWKVVDKNKE